MSDARTLPEKSFDVVVVGGGTSGMFAAMSAARQGLTVALVEASGMLGGTLTQVTLGGICGAWTEENRHQVVHGMFDELVHAMRKDGACEGLYTYGQNTALPYDPVRLRSVLDRMLPDNVSLFLHSRVYDVTVEDKAITRLEAAGPEGAYALRCRVCIDGTGNALLADLAGAPTRRGDNGVVQAASSMFRVAGVEADPRKRDVRAEIKAVIEEHNRSSGEDGVFRRSTVAVYVHPNERLLHFNATRIHPSAAVHDRIDAARDLTRVEQEGRAEAYRLIGLLKSKLDGFQGADIVDMGSSVGIRDSRNVVNSAPLTEDMIRAAHKPDNAVAYTPWPIEIHRSEAATHWEHLGGDRYYGIPYDCMLPEGLDNLLVVGRAISSTPLAQASCRVTAPCMQMGESAGRAAGMLLGDSARKSFHELSSQRYLEVPLAAGDPS